MKYSPEIRETALQKTLGPNGRSIPEVGKEMGINIRTLYGWVSAAKHGETVGVLVSKKKSRKRKVDLVEKYSLLQEARVLSEEELGRWLREKGYHTGQLENWEREITSALNKQGGDVSRELKQENGVLRKELQRKEKALAEVSALLVLKKKFAALLGEEQEP